MVRYNMDGKAFFHFFFSLFKHKKIHNHSEKWKSAQQPVSEVFSFLWKIYLDKCKFVNIMLSLLLRLLLMFCLSECRIHYEGWAADVEVVTDCW